MSAVGVGLDSMKDGPLDNSVNPMTSQLFVANGEAMVFGWECV